MKKIKVQSEEKHFLMQLKNKAPFYGVFGMRHHIGKDGKLSKEDLLIVLFS